MGIFSKKPLEVEAMLWDGTNTSDVKAFIGEVMPGRDAFITYEEVKADYDANPNVHGEMPVERPSFVPAASISGPGRNPLPVNVGDWIIKGIQGEFYPCPADVFAATYDEVIAPPAPVVGP